MAANDTVEYSVFRFSLAVSNIAAPHRFDQRVGYFHLVRFEDDAGATILTGKIEIAFGSSNDDWLPLGYNNKIAAISDRLQIRWEAQANTNAVIITSPSLNALQVDAPPATQLILASLGSVIEHYALTVGLTEVLVDAADLTRQSIMIKNLGTVSIYIGATGVTTVNGMEIPANGSIILDKQSAAIYAISGTAGQNVRVLIER